MKARVLWLLVVVSFLCAPVHAGIVFVNHDEWTLSNTGFSNAPDAGTFAQNVASLFTAGDPGNFLVYSNNFGLTQSNLQSTMTGAGHSWTVNPGITFDEATLAAYDGVFVGGLAANNTVLTNYVNAGGNVYLMGGTGTMGGAGGEAAAWNTFLNAFGLEFESSYNGIGGNLPIDSAHPAFAGVDALYHNNGNSIVDLDPGDPRNAILVSLRGEGLYAIWDPGAIVTPGIPAPGAVLLGSIGAGFVAWMRRRRAL